MLMEVRSFFGSVFVFVDSDFAVFFAFVAFLFLRFVFWRLLLFCFCCFLLFFCFCCFSALAAVLLSLFACFFPFVCFAEKKPNKKASKQARAAHLWIWCAAGGGRCPPPPTPPAPRNLHFISDTRACHEINILR